MSSVMAPAPPTAIRTHLPESAPAPLKREAMPPVQEPTPPHHIKQEEEPERGRARSRTAEREDEDDKDTKRMFAEREQSGDGDGDGDPNHGNSSASDDGPARKRRRSRKGLDKKFECPHENCGKSYSRAEHLYRHQLNHTPKQIYYCGMGDCTRSFVRLDLCNRHKDRHTAKGSTLSRKDRDAMMAQAAQGTHGPHGAHGTPVNTSPQTGPFHGPAPPGSMSPEANRPGTGYNKPQPNNMQFSPKEGAFTQLTNTPPTGYPTNVHPNGQPNGHPGSSHPSGHPNGVGYTHHEQGGYGFIQGQQRPPPPSQHQQQQHQQQRTPQHPPHHSPPGPHPHRPTVQTDVGSYGVLSPVSTQHTGYQSQHNNTPQSTVYVGPQNFPPFSLPPSDFAPTSSPVIPREMAVASPYVHATATSNADYAEQNQGQPASEMMMLDQMAMASTMPVFGSDNILQKSPYVGMPEDFMAYLFNTAGSQQGEGSPLGHMVPPGGYNNNYGEFTSQYSVPYYGPGEPSQMGYFPAAQQIMSVTNLLDQNLPESIISEEKSCELFEFIRDRFHENGAPVERQKESIVEGDRSEDTHMLSRKMMQAYIMSYWLHFSDQVPILHKPTFSPDRTPNLLLMAIMTIGAACLDKTHGQKVTKAGAQLSNFLAWHLRWELFMDTNFRPPAKLWVFQTLLLLELYEKMYSTRELHERAHIHHATTITLMRRGRALIGKSAMDSPPNSREDRPNGSRHSSTSGVAHTPDEWWNHWITNESTRRVAFAAFLIDSIHATMFGHSTVMVAHEMRLPLPCDEKLWKATSGAEVGRLEANLLSNGIKPISFLEGLKRTLSNQDVHTNAFGRTVLMAGLLSVSWHMNQRDLQVNSLGGGVSQALGGRDKWRGTLTRAFDSWRSDFDKALKTGDISAEVYMYEPGKRSEANVVFESRTVLHHLAHMAMHVDIVDCQIFARAKRLLGRAIGQQDLSSAQRRMKDIWVITAKARDAAYYALKFLSSVLLPKEVSTAGSTPSSSSTYGRPEEPYSARDDVLLNRPWVLYFAALVVWCYGHALEGPCPSYVMPASKQEQVRHMREYLTRFGTVDTPEELKGMKGMNNNSALLMVLKDTFDTTRWELLHEGATLLNNCIQLNAGAAI